MGYINGEIDHQVADGNQNVELTVSIGAGQETFRIRVKPAAADNQVNPSYPMSLGKGDAVKGKTSKVQVSVTDDHPDTDETSIKLDLTNGEVSETFEMKAETPGGTVDYYITINHS